MTPPERFGRLAKTIALSTIALACLGTGGCVSQSEKEFAAQYGYYRSDYFGSYQNKNNVPCDVQRHN